MLIPRLLIDGSDIPPIVQLDDRESLMFMSQGRPADTPRNYKFVREVRDGNKQVYIYRLAGEQAHLVSDELFEMSAQAEVDKLLHPEKYTHIGKTGPLSNAERVELEQLRAQVRGR